MNNKIQLTDEHLKFLKIFNGHKAAARKDGYQRAKFSESSIEMITADLIARGVLGRLPEQRPLGGFALETELKTWLEKNGPFGKHLHVAAGRGVLWSPVAWALIMIISNK